MPLPARLLLTIRSHLMPLPARLLMMGRQGRLLAIMRRRRSLIKLLLLPLWCSLTLLLLATRRLALLLTMAYKWETQTHPPLGHHSSRP